VYLLLKEKYSFHKRGRVQLKGRGEMLAYLLKRGPETAGSDVFGMEGMQMQESAA
jgi:hypothetical protein